MLKYPNFAIIGSFFSLWIVSYLSINMQLYIGFFLIFTFGILHGANDIVLIKSLDNSENSFSFFKILLYYLAIVVLGVISFYLFPLLALILFIIVSGYHFGEQQWQCLEDMNKNKLKVGFQMIYGIFILFLLFNFHQIEVQKIVQEITEVQVPIFYISLFLKFLGGTLFGLLLYLYIYM